MIKVENSLRRLESIMSTMRSRKDFKQGNHMTMKFGDKLIGYYTGDAVEINYYSIKHDSIEVTHTSDNILSLSISNKEKFGFFVHSIYFLDCIRKIDGSQANAVKRLDRSFFVGKCSSRFKYEQIHQRKFRSST